MRTKRTLAVSLLWLTGCIGQLGDGSSELAMGGGADESEPSHGKEVFEPESVASCDTSSIGASALRRLNNREWAQAIEDLFGYRSTHIQPFGVDGLNSHNFDTDGRQLWLDDERVASYYDIANDVAQRVVDAGFVVDRHCDVLADRSLACREEALKDFLGRTYRQPVTQVMVDTAVALGEGFESPIERQSMLVLHALLSPHFLFHYKAPGQADVRQVSYEVAGRLASLLWQSVADDELLVLASAGKLVDRSVVEEQVARLLADPRSNAAVESFFRAWMGVRESARMPHMPEEIFEAYERESTTFATRVLVDGRPLAELLSAETSWVDGTVAAAYGLNVQSDTPVETAMPTERQGGLLTQGFFTMLWTPSGVTDPFHRGAVVAEKLLCRFFSVPEGVPEREANSASDPKTKREIALAHTQDPACRSCHQQFDHIGFAMEQYDAHGGYRTRDENGIEIDASGRLFTADGMGPEFEDLTEYARLVSETDAFSECVANAVAMFAVGRDLSVGDRCVSRELTQRLRSDEEFTFERLVSELALSPVFWGRGK